MGATSADTQREIEEIRKDISSAAEELGSRLRRMADVGRHSQRVKENPAALAGLTLAVVGIGGAVATRAVLEQRRRQTPQERLKRTVRGAAEELSERWERAREALPLELHLGSRDDDDDKGGRPAEIRLKEPSMIKRILWGALVAAMVAAGGLIARRLSAAVWRATMKEEPPTASV